MGFPVAQLAEHCADRDSVTYRVVGSTPTGGKFSPIRRVSLNGEKCTAPYKNNLIWVCLSALQPAG